MADEKTMAYNLVRDIAVKILMNDPKTATLFQRFYLGSEEVLGKGKTEMEKISKGTLCLNHEDAEKMAGALIEKLEKGYRIDDYFRPTEHKIQNLEEKKEIFGAVLKYFMKVHNVDKEKIEAVLKKRDPYYTIIEGPDVTKDDIRKALILDIEAYEKSGAYENPSDEAFNIEKCWSWFKKNNQIYTMLKENITGDIVGYINAVPLTDKVYYELRNGEYPDSHITDEDIVKYDVPGYYNLYFASIVIDQKKDRAKRFRLLWEGFLEKLINLAKDDYIVTKILADAISNEGKMMCNKRMKIIKQTNHDHHSTIYEKELYPPAGTQKEAELYDILIKRYREPKDL